jgi:four helix bundle protein
MQRAAVSVPSNIAEGHARESTREYLQHLSIAQASLAELETQVEIAKQVNYISEEDASRMIEKISSLGRQLFALRNALTSPKAKSAMSPGS